MQKFVQTKVLNLRNAPQVDPTTLIGSMDLNQPVEVLAAPDANGWVRAKAEIAGTVREGVCKAEFLRSPVSAQREALLAAARKQWLRFDRGRGDESVDPYFRFVGEMWQAIGLNLDGKDSDQPWSAAFISYVVRQAGHAHPRYNGFKFAPAHGRYVHDAIRARIDGRAAPFHGFRRAERKPQLGDIVCKPRAGSGVTFESAATTGEFKSHSDIVVAIDSPNFKILTIGGNVGDSVTITEYPLGAGDFLSANSGVFALLANMTDA
jgi:hypothetical protein